MSNKNVKFQGIPVLINNEEYIMPPLSPYAFAKCKASEKLAKIDKELKQNNGAVAAISEENIKNLVELITLALKRNYDNITEDEVGNGLPDVLTMVELIGSVISQNKKIEEKMVEERKNAVKQLTQKQES